MLPPGEDGTKGKGASTQERLAPRRPHWERLTGRLCRCTFASPQRIGSLSIRCGYRHRRSTLQDPEQDAPPLDLKLIRSWTDAEWIRFLRETEQPLHAIDCDMDEDCACDIFQGIATGFGYPKPKLEGDA
jgi:hypothetical protein